MKFSSILLCLGLGITACSDMSVDSDDTVVGTSNPDPSAQIVDDMFVLPADFKLDEYVEINPDVKYIQIVQELKKQNAAFLDSMKMTSDSIKQEDGTMVPIATVMKERYAADTSAFIHEDTAFTHKVFLMAGYSEDLWVSADSLNSEQRGFLVRFNKIQSGEPSIKEDKDFVLKFDYDEDLMAPHFLTFGRLEGRPYRYCKGASEIGLLKSEVIPDTLGLRPRIMDYNAHLFCLNKEDGLVYSIK